MDDGLGEWVMEPEGEDRTVMVEGRRVMIPWVDIVWMRDGKVPQKR